MCLLLRAVDKACEPPASSELILENTACTYVFYHLVYRCAEKEPAQTGKEKREWWFVFPQYKLSHNEQTR